MTISKEELIQEIKDQLSGLEIIIDKTPALELSQTLAILDLQFRLKCKLYELTQKDGDTNG